MQQARVPQPRKATGSIAAAFADEPWLYSYDLPDDRDIAVKVEAVLHYPTVDLAGTNHRNVYGLKFAGKKKVLLLTSKATFKAMAKLHGKTFDGWVGKEISLYVDEVDAFGQTVDAIRIRTPKRGRGAATQSAAAFLDDDPGPEEFGPMSTTKPSPGATPAPATTPATGELPLEGPPEYRKLYAALTAKLAMGLPEAAKFLGAHGGDNEKAYRALRPVDRDDLDEAASALDLSEEEALKVLAEHGCDRAKAAASLSVRVNEKLAADA